MNNFRHGFRFRSASCPVLHIVLIISRGECTICSQIMPICNSGNVESEEHFMSRCSKYKSLRDELHIRVNNWLKNAVIEEHILKCDNPYVQKALVKYIFDAFSLRENQMGNKNIPWNNRGNEMTSRRECVADYTFQLCCFHVTFFTYLHI